LWSIYADSNCGPHPYQLIMGCYFLLLVIVPYRSKLLTPQCFSGFLFVPCRTVLPLKKYCFLMPVSVLCRFLFGAKPPDLIPTPAMLRPLLSGAGLFSYLRPLAPSALSHFVPLGRAAKPHRKRVRLDAQATNPGSGGSPSKRFGIAKRISRNIACLRYQKFLITHVTTSHADK